MSEERRCHWCQQPVTPKEWCAPCLAAFPSRPAPHTMTPDEREAEVDALRWAEVPFDVMHGRLEALLGRPVWTHEMTGWNRLVQQARWEDRPATMDEIVSLVPEEKLIVVQAREEAAP